MSAAVQYDIIGDIHGQYEKLRALMDRLGYRTRDLGFEPPEGHQALFLGDLLDPKPNPLRPRAFGGKGAEGMKKEIPSNREMFEKERHDESKGQ